jgi:hypothetical protein
MSATVLVCARCSTVRPPGPRVIDLSDRNVPPDSLAIDNSSVKAW